MEKGSRNRRKPESEDISLYATLQKPVSCTVRTVRYGTVRTIRTYGTRAADHTIFKLFKFIQQTFHACLLQKCKMQLKTALN